MSSNTFHGRMGGAGAAGGRCTSSVLGETSSGDRCCGTERRSVRSDGKACLLDPDFRV